MRDKLLLAERYHPLTALNRSWDGVRLLRLASLSQWQDADMPKYLDARYPLKCELSAGTDEMRLEFERFAYKKE